MNSPVKKLGQHFRTPSEDAQAHGASSPLVRSHTKALIVFILFPIINLMVIFAQPCGAEWELEVESNVFYTNDVALFSPTRRLSRHQDPTQPVLDGALANQGDDVVYEPAAQVTKKFEFMGTPSEILVRGQGFVFLNETDFNHGSLGIKVAHELTPSITFNYGYFFGPNLFLGENEVRESQEDEEDPPQMKDEEVTTHYWATALDYQFPGEQDVTIRLLGRYGLRNYDSGFQQRDTKFWTVGTHVEWALTKKIEVALGYHYERGLADGRRQPELRDDISYYNHFASGELTIELTEQVGLEMGVHYEFNGYTTGIAGDERNGEYENVVQGDILTTYKVTNAIELTAGLQAAYRKESFEDRLENYNTWVGAKMVF